MTKKFSGYYILSQKLRIKMAGYSRMGKQFIQQA
jgi:hypothetical protein